MRNTKVITSNVRKFLEALQELKVRGVGEEGMGLLWGEPGEGKSTTVSYALNSSGGVFLRASVTWSVTSMLRALMTELEMDGGRFRAPMMKDAIQALSLHPRPIFIDEADYLFRQTDMLDALRDIYDVANVPVILIGMEDIARTLRSRDKFKRFRRRITQWVEFKGLTLKDVRDVTDQLCEVEVGDDLVERLHAETSGNIGNVVIGLGRIEAWARGQNHADRVTLAAFGNRRLF